MRDAATARLVEAEAEAEGLRRELRQAEAEAEAARREAGAAAGAAEGQAGRASQLEKAAWRLGGARRHTDGTSATRPRHFRAKVVQQLGEQAATSVRQAEEAAAAEVEAARAQAARAAEAKSAAALEAIPHRPRGRAPTGFETLGGAVLGARRGDERGGAAR